ncbi:hypothetical protein, partial [Neisseria sicca]|uniref:hypothetical protein n=1 Tax=Neisseria sicca TaxID=490 RepID=UPI001C99F654
IRGYARVEVEGFGEVQDVGALVEKRVEGGEIGEVWGEKVIAVKYLGEGHESGGGGLGEEGVDGLKVGGDRGWSENGKGVFYGG